MTTHIYRLRYAERKGYIVSDAHPISGVFFICLTPCSGQQACFAPGEGAFCFSWKASRIWVQRKIHDPKGDVYDERDTHVIKKI